MFNCTLHGPRVICGLSFLLVIAFSKISLSALVFLSPQKPTSPISNLTTIRDPHELRLMQLPLKILQFTLYLFKKPVTCWCLVAIWQASRWIVSSGCPSSITWTITTLAPRTVRSSVVLNRGMWSRATSPSWPVLVTWNVLLCYWWRWVSIHSSVVKSISLYCSLSAARIICILYNLPIDCTKCANFCPSDNFLNCLSWSKI